MARYLVRLDDACPTADWERWDRFEALLDQLGIRPIVAVIPENRDETFDGPTCEDFWGRVKTWEDKGWTLAMHGLHHLYVTGDGGLVPINDFSEFAGLPLAEQRVAFSTDSFVISPLFVFFKLFLVSQRDSPLPRS